MVIVEASKCIEFVFRLDSKCLCMNCGIPVCSLDTHVCCSWNQTSIHRTWLKNKKVQMAWPLWACHEVIENML